MLRPATGSMQAAAPTHSVFLPPRAPRLASEIAVTRTATSHGAFLDVLPTANVACNAASFAFVVAGLLALRRGKIETHKKCMLTGAALMGVFLVGYATRIGLAGPTPYAGEHVALYWSLLATHMLFAVPSLLFLIPRTLYLGLKGKIEKHRALARLTAAAWIAASVTSIPVYLMLYGWPL